MKDKPEARIAFREFVLQKGDVFDNLDSIQRGKYLTRFYVQEILKYQLANLVPDDDDELGNHIVDGGNDQGVDYIYKYDNTVLIIQSKYHKEGKTEDTSEISHFREVLQRLHPLTGKSFKKNRKLEENLADIDWDTDNFFFIFLTLAKATDQLRSQEEQGLSSTGLDIDLISRIQEFRLVDETDMNKEYRDALSASQSINQTIDIRFLADKDSRPWVSYTGTDGKRSYIGKVNGAFLHELYKPHRLKLFWLNIRNYVGDTSTNSGITKTAIENPEWFFSFNNGISAVASQIEEDGNNILKCTRFSIINGAQTVRSIFKAFSKNSNQVKRAEVLLRISEVSVGGTPKDRTYLENITKYNNTQNAIRVADFRSNDLVQTQLATYFQTLSRKGKKFWYKAKRESDKNSDKIAVPLEEFAKAVHAFLAGPIDMFGGVSYLFDVTPKGGYLKVFGNKDEKKEESELQRIIGIWFICEAAKTLFIERKEILEKREQEAIENNPALVAYTKQALERRWIVYWIIGELLRGKYSLEKKSLDDELVRLGKHPDFLESDKDARALLNDYIIAACKIAVAVYKMQTKDSTFVPRNWFRGSKYMPELQQQILDEYPEFEGLSLLRKT